MNIEPDKYLSRNDTGGWTVIHGGMPLCADTHLAGALACAKQYRIDTTGCWWDGALGCFRPASEITP